MADYVVQLDRYAMHETLVGIISASPAQWTNAGLVGIRNVQRCVECLRHNRNKIGHKLFVLMDIQSQQLLLGLKVVRA